MSSPAASIALILTLLAISLIVGFLIYVSLKYTPIIARIFEEKPMFFPMRVTPTGEGEDIRFLTRDGLELAGLYLRARTRSRSGVVVFSHEYLSDRWSVLTYADHLRDEGFDLFSFDYRNHGLSAKDPLYNPLQWVTSHETADLDAALAYVRNRPDADLAGVGLFGISRGGGTALSVAGRDPRVWGVITDGAFPTRGTMSSYIHRWADIYINNPKLRRFIPNFGYEFLSLVARMRIQKKLKCRYEDVERGVSRLSPRPWLSIHGRKDAYIGVDIAEALFDRAGEPKELWIVDGAKHNRCREKEPIAYRQRISEFFHRFAPRATVILKPPGPSITISPDVPLLGLPIQVDVGVTVSS